jgi:GNAT superfamily N-acetyltransferase
MALEPIVIREVSQLPDEILKLVEQSSAEGFQFVARLVDDWNRDANRFSVQGECFVEARCDESLVAVGGLNLDPYADSLSVSRLRHVYVIPDFRRRGVGRAVVDHLVDQARMRFHSVRLRTDTPDAAQFYETLGFRKLSGDPDATHALWLRHSLTGRGDS